MRKNYRDTGCLGVGIIYLLGVKILNLTGGNDSQQYRS